MIMKTTGRLVAFLLTLNLAACGGGGGGAGEVSVHHNGGTEEGWTVSGGSGAEQVPSEGAGGVPAGSWPPAATLITGGVAVDPYIVGATFFEDVNGNGRLDAGEQVSTPSDAQGRFSFVTPVPAGRAIIMHERGLHQGVPFTGRLVRRIEAGDPSRVVVSPLTTMASLGLSPAELSFPLTLLNNPLGSDYDLDANPMTGLEEVGFGGPREWNAITGLRANLYLGAVLDLFMLNRELAGLNAEELRLLLHHWEPLYDLMEGLRHAVSAETVHRLAGELPAGGLPPVTMREVAEAMPAVLNWWKQEIMRQVIAGEAVSISAGQIMDQVDSVLPGLALRYYVRNHAAEPAVQQAVTAGWLPAADGDHFALEKSGAIAAANQTIRKEHLVGQVFALGPESRLRFFNGGENQGVVELTCQSGGAAAKLTGTWRIESSLLSLQGSDSDRILQLELETDWTSHLSLRIKGEAPTDLAPATFLGRLLDESGHLRITG